MITIPGISHNITQNIVCRVAFPGDLTEEQDFLFFNSPTPIEQSVNGILTHSPLLDFNHNLPVFQISNYDTLLFSGDILLLTPRNFALKIFDINSHTNSIFLTGRCNSRCLSCPQPPIVLDEFNWSQIAIEMLKLIPKGSTSIGITGGEPTLEWTSLVRVIKECRERHPDTYIQLLTNGIILTDYQKVKILSDLGENKLSIGIPLNADVDTIHDFLSGAKGSFWKTIAALCNCGNCNINTELRFVINKANYHRLPYFPEFVYRNLSFIDHIAFMGIEIIGFAKSNFKELWIDPSIYLKQLDQAIKLLSRRNIDVSIFNHPLCILPQHLWPIAVKSISEWKIEYFDECEYCIEKLNCGGVFYSSKKYLKDSIRSIL